MDQYVVFHFNIKKNDRNYQVIIQPGSPFEEVQEVLEQFKADFKELQAKQIEAAEKAKHEAEQEAIPVEAEIV